MYFTINDLKMYYEKYGTGDKNILILPGWGETRKTFYPMINFFKNNYTIYIVDYPGFGNSPFPNHNLTIYDYTNLIIDFMNINNIKNSIIIAHSFGGRIAITMNGYLKHNINKLILIGSAGIKPKKTFYQKLKQLTYKFLKKASKILPKKRRKKYLNYLLQIFGSSDFQKLNANQRKTFINIVNEDLTSFLKDISAETLLIWGENDDATPLKDGRKMEQEIKNSGLVILKNRSHFCYLEEINLTNKIIEHFIKEKNTE